MTTDVAIVGIGMHPFGYLRKSLRKRCTPIQLAFLHESTYQRGRHGFGAGSEVELIVARYRNVRADPAYADRLICQQFAIHYDRARHGRQAALLPLFLENLG